MQNDTLAWRCCYDGCPHSYSFDPDEDSREVFASMRDNGWTRKKGVGWVCPSHSRKYPLPTARDYYGREI